MWLDQIQRGCRLGGVDRLTWTNFRPGDELQGVLSGLGLWLRQAVVALGLDELQDGGRCAGEELDDLGLEQVLKDPGLRPVARTRTKTGLT